MLWDEPIGFAPCLYTYQKGTWSFLGASGIQSAKLLSEFNAKTCQRVQDKRVIVRSNIGLMRASFLKTFNTACHLIVLDG